jgi:hypothetical protein
MFWLGIAMPIITLIAGNLYWQMRKRDTFLRTAIKDDGLLREFITTTLLDEPPARVALFAKRLTSGYVHNIMILNKSDEDTQRRVKRWFLVVGCGATAVASWSGPVFDILTALAFFASYGFPVAQSSKANALEHIASMAVIMRNWMRDEPSQYDTFIAGATSIDILDAVVREREAGRNGRVENPSGPQGCGSR